MADVNRTDGRLVIPYVAGDQGTGRPLGTGIDFWSSPNIRLVRNEETADFMLPETWDDQKRQWDGSVDVSDPTIFTNPYYLMVRVWNRGDYVAEPKGDALPVRGLRLEGWVANYSVGGVGPDSAIARRTDPGGVLNYGNPTFEGSNRAVVQQGGWIVVQSDDFWVPHADDISQYNNGHVCLGANVYSEGGGVIGGGGGVIHLVDTAATYPKDGKPLSDRPAAIYISPTVDTHHGQRNLMITNRNPGQTLVRKVLLEVPATDRCPLEAEVALRPVRLEPGSEETVRFAAALGLSECHCPTDPLDNVSIDDNGDPSHEVGVCLQPGEQVWLTITVEPIEGEKPGDMVAFDIVTVDENTEKVYGAARMVVAVTSPEH
ncbi:hypothetical protein [Nocardia transvalensis]|uniref:hypothetical protein n=1 Tax=Nocardia transvalensis TaxID=37333 RepID=UPI001893B7C7|nr:hypothetical protein [Nocardia transvalensis]MBF6328316.1 hypothetical protein [Nocardia transvalensis]